METIAADGSVLAYILRGGPPPSQTTYLTPDDCNLQVCHVVYPAAGKGAALDPTNVAAARRLRDAWLALGWDKLQKQQSEGVEAIGKDAAAAAQRAA